MDKINKEEEISKETLKIIELKKSFINNFIYFSVVCESEQLLFGLIAQSVYIAIKFIW